MSSDNYTWLANIRRIQLADRLMLDQPKGDMLVYGEFCYFMLVYPGYVSPS